jgi:hypothetical protein
MNAVFEQLDAVRFVTADSSAAMSIVAKGGMVVWHDYGVWADVTTALEEIEGRGRYGLRHIAGTSLVFRRKT